MRPKYVAQYDLPAIVRGDTLDAWQIKAELKKDDTPLVPVSVCMQIRGMCGLAVDVPCTVAPDGTVTIGAVSATQTAQMRAGIYRYDVEYTFAGGRVKTYLQGALTVQEDVSRCSAI